ncbi:hypothetical protein D3C75_921420 [compost metagenome]
MGLGAAQGQAAEQVIVGQVDVRRYRPGVVAGQCQVAHGLRDIAQVEVAHAGQQVLEEPRGRRFRGCGRGRAGRAAQFGDERLLGLQDLLDVAVTVATHGGQALRQFLHHVRQVAAHEQRIGNQVVAGIAAHRQVTAHAP